MSGQSSKAGQLELLELYYREHGPLIMRYLSHRAGSDIAGDMLQDVFVEAARHFSRLARADSPRAWLLKVAYHQLCNYYHRQHKVYELPVELADEHAGEDERLAEMRSAIARLDVSSREIVLLRWYEQLSYEDISHVLELPVGTVRSRLHYSLKKLRDMIVTDFILD